MSKFNADLIEDPEVTVGGKTYRANSSPKVMKEVVRLGKQAREAEEENDENALELFSEMIGLMLNEDPAKFVDLSVRKQSAIVNFLTKEILGDAEGNETSSTS